MSGIHIKVMYIWYSNTLRCFKEVVLCKNLV